MKFQDILIIWLAVLLAAYISGWVVHILGRRARNLSGVSYHAPAESVAPYELKLDPRATRDDVAGDRP